MQVPGILLGAGYSNAPMLCLDRGGRHQNEVQEKARQDRKECVYYFRSIVNI